MSIISEKPCPICGKMMFNTSEISIGIELPISEQTMHKCTDGKIYRLYGLRSKYWFVIGQL